MHAQKTYDFNNVTPVVTLNAKILLIDDSNSVLTLVSSKLKEIGYEVVSNNNPNQAFEQLALTNPACIVVDYEMPDLTGPEFAAKLKGSPAFKKIPIIILTSKDQPNYLFHAIQSGADDFIGKSAHIYILACKIEAMLRLGSMQRELAELNRVAALNQMIVTYNHELNNPLAIAIGATELIKSTNADPHLTILEDALLRISGIIKRISQLKNFEETPYVGNIKMINLSGK